MSTKLPAMLRDSFKANIGENCRAYVEEGKPQKDDYEKMAYEECCEKAFYCSIWAEPWLWYTIVGVIFLLILISVAGSVYFCCIRKRGGAGGDAEIQKTLEECEVDNQKGDSSECDSSESSCNSDCG